MAKPLNLFWSRGTGKNSGPRNAGDWYSPLICERLSGRTVRFAPVARCDLVAVGSLLDRLVRSHPLHRLGFRRALTIWGTGTLQASDHLPGTHAVFALRGRRTAERVAASASAVLGDPGLLADLLLEQRPPQTRALALVVHQAHLADPLLAEFLRARPQVRALPATLPVLELLREIAASEAVLSTSLHGLIFADALQVPNRWVELPGLVGGRFKFADYYSVFGLDAAPLDLAAVDVSDPVGAYERPGLAELKAGLVASFPG